MIEKRPAHIDVRHAMPHVRRMRAFSIPETVPEAAVRRLDTTRAGQGLPPPT